MVALGIRFNLSGVWVAQRIQIDATSGLYDWIKRRVRMGPNATTVSFNDLKFGKGGKTIDTHPEIEAWGDYSNLAPGEIGMDVLDLGHFTIPSEYPALDPLVLAEDADLRRPDIDKDAFVSDSKWAG